MIKKGSRVKIKEGSWVDMDFRQWDMVFIVASIDGNKVRLIAPHFGGESYGNGSIYAPKDALVRASIKENNSLKEYDVCGIVSGSRYLGRFKAKSKEEAEELALASDKSGMVSLCWSCAYKISDPEITECVAELVEE